MQPVTSYKFLGLLAVALLLLGLSFVVIKWPQGKHLTFSQHVAKQKESIVYYTLLFGVVLPILILFFVGWFTPTFKLNPWFNVLLIVSSITQLSCTLIPEVGGWKTQYHRALAGISAICLIPALLFVVIANQVSMTARVLSAVGVLAMLVIAVIVAKNNGKHSHFLILQSAYFVAFFIPILVASYL
jgi:hypothetical protein